MITCKYCILDLIVTKMRINFYLFRFYPIDKSVYKKPYAPLMLTSSKYGAPNYGTKYFRDESNPQEMMGGVSEVNLFI